MTRIESLIASSQAGDLNAKEVLVRENAGLIWSVTRRFIGRGVETDDLYQLGCLGFIKAIDGFDLTYGTQFSTYAVPKITGEIRRFLRDDGAVKISRSIKEQAAKIKKTRSDLISLLGREPTVLEIERQTGISIEDIAVAENATSVIESINSSADNSDFSLESVLSSSETEDTVLEKMALRDAIGKLPEREMKVIKLRYYHGLTQERIARLLEVSQVQVSRIEKRAITRLRELIG